MGANRSRTDCCSLSDEDGEHDKINTPTFNYLWSLNSELRPFSNFTCNRKRKLWKGWYIFVYIISKQYYLFQVCIVQKRDTGRLFAMKYVSRIVCESRGALGGVIKEVELLSTLEHPFLVNLWFSFQGQ